MNFLRNLGINFKNIEGIWQGDKFVTILGTFEEYLLEMIYRLHSKVKVEIRLCTKVSFYCFCYISFFKDAMLNFYFLTFYGYLSVKLVHHRSKDTM